MEIPPKGFECVFGRETHTGSAAPRASGAGCIDDMGYWADFKPVAVAVGLRRSLLVVLHPWVFKPQLELAEKRWRIPCGWTRKLYL